MNGYLLPLSCPLCGGAMEHVNAGAGGTSAAAVAACPACRRQFEIVVTIRPHGQDPLAEQQKRRRQQPTVERPRPRVSGSAKAVGLFMRQMESA